MGVKAFHGLKTIGLKGGSSCHVREILNMKWEVILEPPPHLFFSGAHDLYARPSQCPAVKIETVNLDQKALECLGQCCEEMA